MPRTLHRDDIGNHGPSGVAVALLVLIMVALTALIAVSRDGGQAPDTRSADTCASIADDGARLDCYDRSAHRKPEEPAKGSNAPVD